MISCDRQWSTVPFQVQLHFDDLLPFSKSQSPAIHPHDEHSDADDIESTGCSQATSTFLDDSSHADTTADESATTDYHLILNSKFIHLKSSALLVYWLICIACPCDEHGNFLNDHTTAIKMIGRHSALGWNLRLLNFYINIAKCQLAA